MYSLGVLLHHLLTGSYPVVAADLRGLRLAHARGRLGRGTMTIAAAAVLLLLAGGVWQLRGSFAERPNPTQPLARGFALTSACGGRLDWDGVRSWRRIPSHL